jgi:hypothetical protein
MTTITITIKTTNQEERKNIENWKHALLGLTAMKYGFFSTKAHAVANMSKRQRPCRRFFLKNFFSFFFLFLLYFPPPKKGGGVGWWRAAAARRARG